MRQIVWRERKRFAQLSVENLECGGQFALDTGARGRFFQIWKMWNRIAERDPDRRAPRRGPGFFCGEEGGARRPALSAWGGAHVRQRRGVRSEWCGAKAEAG